MHDLYSNIPFSTQCLPSSINHQDQYLSCNITTNQSHTLPNARSSQPFQTLESTSFPFQNVPMPQNSYQTSLVPWPPSNPTTSSDCTVMTREDASSTHMPSNSSSIQTLSNSPPQFYKEIPFYNHLTSLVPSSNPVTVPGASMHMQRMKQIDYENNIIQNTITDCLYHGNFGRMDNDPYYCTRMSLPRIFAPYFEVTGCWPNLQVKQESAPRKAGRKRKSSSSTSSIISYPTLPLLPCATKMLTLVLKKELQNSDVNRLNRIILPKHEAKHRLPFLENKAGIIISVRDALSPDVWIMTFRFWFNNSSQIFVLENTGDFVRKYELKSGDFMALYEDENKQLYIIGRRNSDSPDSFDELGMNLLPPQEIFCSTIKSQMESPPVTSDAGQPRQEEINSNVSSIDHKDLGVVATKDSNELDWLSLLNFSGCDDSEPAVFDENMR